MIRRLAPWSVCMQPKKGCIHIPSQIKKNSQKIYVDWRFNLDFRKLKIVIKFSRKDAILTALHASADHHSCRHQDRLVASIWHLDKSGKIPKKLKKIFYLIYNVITKNCFNIKVFDRDKGSLNHEEMWCFCTHVRDILLFPIFYLPQKF